MEKSLAKLLCERVVFNQPLTSMSEARRLISLGMVKVNGMVETDVGRTVSENDRIEAVRRAASNKKT